MDNIAMDSIAQNMSDKAPHVSHTKREHYVNPDLALISEQNIEPLRDDNWIAWKIRITRILRLFGVLDYVTGTEVKPASDEKSYEYKEWKNKDLIARMAILHHISPEQMDHVLDEPDMQTASGIWEKLKGVHQERSYQKASLRTLHYLLRTRAEEGDVLRHVAVMQIKRQTLANLGNPMADGMFKTVLLLSLPPSWEWFAMCSFAAARDDSIDTQQLVDMIKSEYKRRYWIIF